jgi:uncharacterized protein (TIGR04222 family)
MEPSYFLHKLPPNPIEEAAMTDTEPWVWDAASRELWQRIAAHRFEAPDQGIDFTRRLAREQGWTLEFARRAVDEYRRYCFLSSISAEPLTPSVEVDEVWHLHLIHTRDYWDAFCGEVLRRPLHHGPTRGGRAALQTHHRQYGETLAVYESWFGSAPHDLWPDARTRFANPASIRRVDLRRVWLLPRPRWPTMTTAATAFAALAASLGAGAAWALPTNPLDWNGGDFLLLYVALIPAVALLSAVLRRGARDVGAGDASNLNPFELAYLAGGPARCVDASVAELLASKGADWDEHAKVLRIYKDAVKRETPLDIVARCIDVDGKPDAVLKKARLALDPVRRRLEARKLLLDDAAVSRARWLSVLPLLALLALGGAKIYVGIARDRPVGFLVFLTFVMTIVTLIVLFKRPSRSSAGDATLKLNLQRHERAVRAPKDAEVGLAVALIGTAALSGTAYAQYHSVRQPPTSSSSSDSSSSSSGGDSGGGDSGGGGGGCGGCGGGGD